VTDGSGRARVRRGPLGSAPPPPVASPGVRVVLDARPLQEPDRAPLTAAYLDGLLGAFDDEPIAGESFAFLLRSDLDDPTAAYAHLEVIGRRLLPPTRLLRSGAMTVDPFLLRGASLGAAWRADRGGAAGAVYHMAGSGPLPIASGLPVVATLLDLAPWELPDAFGHSASARFGQRLRAQLLREARAVIVSSPAVAQAARRLLHLHPDRIHVVGLAPQAAFAASAGRDAASDARVVREATRERERLGVPHRYLVYAGRYDARHDLATLLGALAALGAEGRPEALDPAVPWPPRVLVVGASPDDRAAIARTAARLEAGDLLSYAPQVAPSIGAGLVRGARAAIIPLLSDAAGLGALDAIAVGTPVVAASVGALTDLVGTAGILVEPRDVDRLAVALRAVWSEDRVHARIAEGARTRATADRRGWDDVARETRAVYAAAGTRRD
jgi:glycosyltransferase involved in cell wall biosynthesis